MTLAEANVKFKTEGVDKVVSGINKVVAILDTNADKARSFASAVSSTAIGTAIGNWITDLPSKFLNLGKEMFNASVEAESMNSRMLSMSKNAAEAKKEIEFINDEYAAKHQLQKEKAAESSEKKRKPKDVEGTADK